MPAAANINNPSVRYLTLQEAADMCRLSPMTVRRRMYEGTGPRVVRVGRRVVFRDIDMHKWMEDQTGPSYPRQAAASEESVNSE